MMEEMTKINKIRKFCINLSHSSKFNTFFAIIVMIYIIIFILSTEFKVIANNKLFTIIGGVTIITLFSIEYIIRIIGANCPLKEVKKPIMILDLFVIVSLFASINMPYLRAFRLIRLISIFRKRRYKIAAITIKNVWRNHSEEMISAGIFFIILIFISASLMHFLEGNRVCFSSIPRAMYWAIITATSVGYGDVVPVTIIGKMIACITSIAGFLSYTMITIIFATGFSREWRRTKKEYKDS